MDGHYLLTFGEFQSFVSFVASKKDALQYYIVTVITREDNTSVGSSGGSIIRGIARFFLINWSRRAALLSKSTNTKQET